MLTQYLMCFLLCQQIIIGQKESSPRAPSFMCYKFLSFVFFLQEKKKKNQFILGRLERTGRNIFLEDISASRTNVYLAIRNLRGECTVCVLSEKKWERTTCVWKGNQSKPMNLNICCRYTHNHRSWDNQYYAEHRKGL